MILIDIFIQGDDVILWCKDKGRNYYFADHSFSPVIYLRTSDPVYARRILKGCMLTPVTKKHMVDGTIDVLEVRFSSIGDFNRRFHVLEHAFHGKGTFFNADIALEEMYFFHTSLYPFCEVEIEYNGDSLVVYSVDDYKNFEYFIPDLNTLRLTINYDRSGQLTSLICNDFEIVEDILESFISLYLRLDPDIIFIHKQQSRLLKLFSDCSLIDSRVSLHRYGNSLIKENPGYSYWSYGVRYFRESPVYLHGRFLINSGSFIDDTFTPYSLIEGARFCRMRLQKVASHSVGRTITSLLTYQALIEGYLIPYKIGVYERVKPFADLIECDRGALTLEPTVGLHHDVAELDFVSMYPAIMSKYNLSPETLYCSCCKDQELLFDTPYYFCQKKRGIVPQVCDLLLERRAYFKSCNDHISSAKVGYLKWLLVVIFGFQAYKNKKIGCIEAHEAINACAREVLLKSIHLAEDYGYEVIHGIVDSLYVKKEGTILSAQEGKQLALIISKETGLPIEFKQLYAFITFLPSVINSSHPVPSSYYGVGVDGKIKIRGIEYRKRNSPAIVKNLQAELIESLGRLVSEKGRLTAKDMHELFYRSVTVLRNHIVALSHATVSDLSIRIRIGKEKYRVNCPQKSLKMQLLKNGIVIHPGQSVDYIIVDYDKRLYCVVDECKNEFNGKFDTSRYIELLKNAFLHLFLPFELTLAKLNEVLAPERQQQLVEYFGSPLKKDAVLVIH